MCNFDTWNPRIVFIHMALLIIMFASNSAIEVYQNSPGIVKIVNGYWNAWGQILHTNNSICEFCCEKRIRDNVKRKLSAR